MSRNNYFGIGIYNQLFVVNGSVLVFCRQEMSQLNRVSQVVHNVTKMKNKLMAYALKLNRILKKEKNNNHGSK